jgi:hypothetical protein
MYKIFDENNNTICVKYMHEVRELTGATDAQIKKLASRHNMKINGFEVNNYTR